jgi:hypothetical protein
MTADRRLSCACGLLLLLLCRFCGHSSSPPVHLGVTSFLDGVANPGSVVELIGRRISKQSANNRLGQPTRCAPTWFQCVFR